MSYRRIYSLSTVGILKHYVHDYLFHPLRTDFIGPNGVGKSIIADLLQLMFVYDTSLIRFGTDGMKKEERTIYKLPYKISTGYCFLNIEVQADKYLVIGIAISSQSGNRIVPFLVAKSAEIGNNFDELYLSKDQLLIAKDFLEGQLVPDIKTLAAKLLTEKTLFLSSFRNKDDVKRYYQFLYDKSVLSINLSIDENLSAFAKVIQSFSKAKSLDLRPDKASKSLKEFLFEESEGELYEAYKKQQSILEKLLREFSDLNNYTTVLSQKQEQLQMLKELDSKQNEGLRTLKAAEILSSISKQKALQSNEERIKEELKQEEENLKNLQAIIIRLPQLQKALGDQNQKSNSHHFEYQKYRQVNNRIEHLNGEITELKLLNPPKLSKGWLIGKDQFDLSTRTSQQFKELISFGTPYFNKYQTFEEIENIYEAQSRELSQLMQSIAEENKYYEKLIAILANKDEGSVFGWGLQRLSQLSNEQLNLLLYYATLPVKLPHAPVQGSRYMDAEELFGKATVIVNKKQNGLWVKLGPLREFIFFNKEPELFRLLEDIDATVAAYLQKVKSNYQLLEQKEKELNNISKGKEYDKKIIDEDFDLQLMNYHNVEKLKEAAGCAIYLKEKITELERAKATEETEWINIRALLPSNVKYNEPEVVERELKEIADRNLQRLVKLATFEGRSQSNFNKTEEAIRGLKTKLFSMTEEILENQMELNKLDESYYKNFGENFDPLADPKTDQSVEDLRNHYRSVVEKYRLNYLDIINHFEETKNNGNVAVGVETLTSSFSFSVLEEALLGIKIRHTDDIAPALNDANLQRLHMADGIKNTMVKIFEATVERYKEYKDLVYLVNTFFHGRKISGQFYFSIDFKKNERLTIELVEEIGTRMRNAAKQGELAFDQPVTDFIEMFFKKTAKISEKLPIAKLLDPKTYFDLSTSLTDETKVEVPGSTGETYSAIALLGIARLSVVQKEKRPGLRFIILEELGSLDNSNFSTFPAIAKEFDYQIITMSPAPFRSDIADEWYAHHLIKGIADNNINYYPSASYFKTNDRSQELQHYLKLL